MPLPDRAFPLFVDVVDMWKLCEAHPSKLQQLGALTGFLVEVLTRSPREAIPCVSLLTNQLSTPYENVPPLGVGERILCAALQDVLGLSAAELKAAYIRLGDLGCVSAEARPKALKAWFGGPGLVTSTPSVQDAFGASTPSVQDALGATTPSVQDAFGATTPSAQDALGTSTQSVQDAFGATTPSAQAALGTTTPSAQAALGTSTQSIQDTFGTPTTLERGPQTPNNNSVLTASDVFNALGQIARQSGTRSRDRRLNQIRSLLVQTRVPDERRYIVKLLQGRLRANLGAKTVIKALAHALVMIEVWPKTPTEDDLKRGKEILGRVYASCPSYEIIMKRVCGEWTETADQPPERRRPFLSLSDLSAASVTCLSIPVESMLATPISDAEASLPASPFVAEFKYDGERAQVHIGGDGKVHIFSRNLMNSTARFPDLIDALVKASAGHALILDGELVAYDSASRRVLAYQILSTRARKAPKLDHAPPIRVCLFVFDLIYCDGESLLEMALEQRRAILRRVVQPVESSVEFAAERAFPGDRVGDDEANAGANADANADPSALDTGLMSFLRSALASNCEGLVIKVLASKYEPGHRSSNWLKLKKDYMDDLADSVDLVPIGAWYGRGRRTGFYGAYLLACYDAGSDAFQSACKLATGFGASALRQFTDELRGHERDGPQPNYDTGLSPDVWFDPVMVWEVRAAELSVSPVHRASIGLVRDDRGLGLRFPRFVRRRDDKDVMQASTSAYLAQLYKVREKWR